ncbi:MAG: c-type cytochrome [Vicinamibacterales bacterium]|nr:c-type cytochrome [Vicinamibacterales bacterium]
MKQMLATAVLLSATVGGLIAAQAPVPPAPPVRGGVSSFPAQQREPDDPVLVARGGDLYGIECRGCHGPDLRGGEMGGPNLLRSSLVLNDQSGELLLPVIHGSRKDQGMPAIGISAEDVKAVAAFIHSVAAKAPGQGAPPPGPPVTLNVLVGDPKAGEAYFSAKCGTCHSITGDLSGIGTRNPGPVQLQNLWVAGGRGGGRGASLERRPPPMTTRREITVTVTQPGGKKTEGRLERIDDFLVALTLADGTPRSFRRDGEIPYVEVHDPLEAHRNLLAVYSDKDIHDVTAYLASVK